MAPKSLCHRVRPSASALYGAIMQWHFNKRSNTDGSEAEHGDVDEELSQGE